MSCLNDENSVPVAPLREAYERSGLSAVEVAKRAGHVRRQTGSTKVIGDGSWTLRRLGLKPDSSSHGFPARLKGDRIHYSVAEQFVRAMDLDPVDFNI
jgi:hypothetical protein